MAVNPERFRQIEELYHSARRLEPGDRAAFLAEACNDDQELRREVEALLSQDLVTGPMEQPPLEVAGKLLGSSTVTKLSAGASLGPYRIEALLGSGGMARFTARLTLVLVEELRSRSVASSSPSDLGVKPERSPH